MIVISINQDSSQFLMNWDLQDIKGFVLEAHNYPVILEANYGTLWPKPHRDSERAQDGAQELTPSSSTTNQLVAISGSSGAPWCLPGSLWGPLWQPHPLLPFQLVYQSEGSGIPLVFEGCLLSLSHKMLWTSFHSASAQLVTLCPWDAAATPCVQNHMWTNPVLPLVCSCELYIEPPLWCKIFP